MSAWIWGKKVNIAPMALLLASPRPGSELDLFDDHLANVVFVKDYYYAAQTEEPIVGNQFRKRHTERHRLGVGDSLRYRFASWLYAKASYEYATRLPRPDEVFGDAVLVHANLALAPEISHNLNVGPRLELTQPAFGKLMIEVNAFLRATDRLIVLLGNDRFFTYQNVYEARGMGLENSFNWESPGRYVFLDGMLTWQNVRNASSEGTFGDFEGDRIPNRPYLFGSWGARVRVTSVPTARDSLEPLPAVRSAVTFRVRRGSLVARVGIARFRKRPTS